MKLADYLSTKNITATQFASQIGVTQSSVSRFCSGARRPDLTTLQRIHEVTGGKVRAEDFFDRPDAGSLQ